MKFLHKHPKLMQFALLLVVFLTLCAVVVPSETNVFWRFPSLFAGLPGTINAFAEYLMYDWMLIEIYDPELEEFEESALIKELTRGFSRGVLFCIDLIREILLGGVKTIVAFTSWDFIKENKWAVWPALPWTVVAGGAIILGYALKGKGLALLAGLATGYIAIFGQWVPAMETLSFVLVAAPVSCVLGLLLGSVAYKSNIAEVILKPLLNVAQTNAAFFLSHSGYGVLWCWGSCRSNCNYHICNTTDDPAYSFGIEAGFA